METISIKTMMDTTIFANVESLKDVSDGYHTIEELYQHRILLFLSMCLYTPFICFYKLDPNIPDWVIVYIYLKPEEGQISYHIPIKYLPVIKEFAIEDQDHKWDGHTSTDVLNRLEDLIANVKYVKDSKRQKLKSY